MPIITITTDAYSNGHDLAEKIAQKMGYPRTGDDITSVAAETYDVAEAKLAQALKSAPSFFDSLSSKRHRFIACLEAVLMEKMLTPEVVYCGFLGIPKIQHVSHAIKVRIIANPDERIKTALQEERLSSKMEAKDRIFKEDTQRQRWCKAVYGIDITDASLYDLVVNLGHMEAQDAIETIAMTAAHKKFQPMTYSLNCMQDIVLSAHIKAAFVDMDPKMKVKSDRGSVYIYAGALKRKKQAQLLALKQRIMQTKGVQHTEIYVKKEIFDDKARGH